MIRGEPMTLREVAEVLGCSPQNVHRIEQQALSKLRSVMRLRGLTLTDLIPEPEPKESAHEFLQGLQGGHRLDPLEEWPVRTSGQESHDDHHAGW